MEANFDRAAPGQLRRQDAQAERCHSPFHSVIGVEAAGVPVNVTSMSQAIPRSSAIEVFPYLSTQAHRANISNVVRFECKPCVAPLRSSS